MNFVFELLQRMVLASIPAVGFALVFNVPARALKFCAGFGAFAYGLRFSLLNAGVPIEWATLIAASSVSFLGVYYAQRLRAHPKVFTVAAMIPMIQGVPLFTTLIALAEIHHKGFSQELFSKVVSSGLRAGFIVCALAIGLAMPGLLYYRRRPVV